MSIASEITRIQNAKTALKTSINAKTDQQHQIANETIDDYASFVDSITTGGGDINEYFYDVSDLGAYQATYLIKKFPYSIDLKNKTNAGNLFSGFWGIKEITIINGESITAVGGMFGTCTSLTRLDIRDMTITINTNGWSSIFGNSASNRIPANCLIIVKDQAQKSFFNDNLPRYTNIKTVEEITN